MQKQGIGLKNYVKTNKKPPEGDFLFHSLQYEGRARLCRLA